MKEKNMGYQCCICHKIVEESKLDICALTLTTNIQKDWKQQKEQTFFCHLECFRKVVNNDNIMYILENDFSTLGEISEENSNDDE